MASPDAASPFYPAFAAAYAVHWCRVGGIVRSGDSELGCPVSTRFIRDSRLRAEPGLLDPVMDLIWNRQIHPGRVSGLELPRDDAAAGYQAMDVWPAVRVPLRL